MSVVASSQSRDAIEYLWNGKKGRAVPIPEWTRAVFGHSSSRLNQSMVRAIARYRRFAEARGYGMLISIHEDAANGSRVTHILLADESTNPKYTARELRMRQARAMGFLRSRDRGVKIALKDKLLPLAEVKQALAVPALRPMFLPAHLQEKGLAEAAERAERKQHPQVGKPVSIRPLPKSKK